MWYATAPYGVEEIRRKFGDEATAALEYTVSALTWRDLHAAVAEQVAMYEALVEGLE
ncbi:hypothetical protein [Streptomyces sp. WG5]|uniref:hypothetical protein n=1 Tax=Streptomyces sp. WG5 TaxID=3417648 RepID=UPI003CF5C85D